mgnify:CR=1 FL=1
MQHCNIGWGIDHVWPHLLHYPSRGIAIIDAIAMEHTNPIGGSYSVPDALQEKHNWFSKFGLQEDWEVLHQLTL